MTERSRQELLYKTGALYEQLIENQDEKGRLNWLQLLRKPQMKKFISRLQGIIQRGNRHC